MKLSNKIRKKDYKIHGVKAERKTDWRKLFLFHAALRIIFL